MNAFVKLFLLLGCGVALMTGCVTGPRYSELKASFPALAQDDGRIFFYRIDATGAAIEPAIKLNHQVVGKANVGEFFYVDRVPGNYEVETKTEVKRTLSMLLNKGETRFVRLNTALGFFVVHIYPELVDNEVAEKEIAGCVYTDTNHASIK